MEEKTKKREGQKSCSTEVNAVVNWFGEKQLTHGSVNVLLLEKAATQLLKSSCTEIRNRSKKDLSQDRRGE